MSDWIDNYMAFTDGITSPPLFRQWTGIAAIAGALERRTYVTTAKRRLYPNLFTLLVATPGIGKSEALSQVQDLWYDTKDLKVAPSNMTKASLIDAISRASRHKMISPVEMIEYHSLVSASSELGVLLPAL